MLFQSKISLKDVIEIEKNLVAKISIYEESFQKIYEQKISKITDIYFSFNPSGITLMREILDNKRYEEIKRKSKSIQKIFGLKVYNKSTRKFEQIILSFSNYQLSFIYCDNPKKIHKNYDFKNIEIENLQIEEFPIQNPDIEIVKNILKLKEKQLQKLDLQNCFEIEFNKDLYYTILDFEDGNYIAVDKKGKIFFLNHNEEIMIRKISENIEDFLSNYNGDKNDLLKNLNKKNDR